LPIIPFDLPLDATRLSVQAKATKPRRDPREAARIAEAAWRTIESKNEPPCRNDMVKRIWQKFIRDARATRWRKQLARIIRIQYDTRSSARHAEF